MALIQLRRLTAAQWTAGNPVLAFGEPGYESDTNKLKIGNGSTAWNGLAYFAPSSSTVNGSGITINGKTGTTFSLVAADVGAIPKPATNPTVESTVTVKPDGTFGIAKTVDDTTIAILPSGAAPTSDSAYVRDATGIFKWVPTSQFITSGGTAGPAGAGALTWTSVKNTNYTAIPGNAIPVDCKTPTSADVVINLPNGVTGQADIRVRRVDNGWNTYRTARVARPDGSVDVLQPGADVTYSWTGTVYVSTERSRPFVMVTPPMRNADDLMPVGAGKTSPQIRQAERISSVQLYRTTDGAFTTTGGGTATVVQDPAPYHVDGNPMLRVTSNNSYTVANYVIRLPYNIDMTDNIIGFMNKFTRNAQGVRGVRVDLDSNNFASGNYIRANIAGEMLFKDTWMKMGAHISQFVGSGVDITQINAIRFQVESQAGTGTAYSFDWSLAELWFSPNLSKKAKCVIWFDDGRNDTYQVAYPYLARYGFRGTLAYTPGSDDSMPPSWARRLQESGWQIGSHSFSIPEHSGLLENGSIMLSDQFRQSLAKSDHAFKTFGLNGGDDWGWWNGLEISDNVLRAVSQYYRSGRYLVTGGPSSGETLPPHNPMITGAYLAGTNDMGQVAYCQKIVSQRGLAQFVYHSVGTKTADGTPSDTGFKNLVEWLDANRDIIDVVTVEEALSPWTTESVVERPVYSKPATPAAPTVSQGPSKVIITAPSISTVGTAPLLGYSVYRSGSSTGTYTMIGSIKTGFTYEDTTAVAGTTYFYKVAARNYAGPSGLSAASVGISSGSPLSYASSATGGKNLLLSNNVGSATGPIAGFGNAASFNGNSQFLYVPKGSGLSAGWGLIKGSPWTIEAFFKRSRASISTNEAIFSMQDEFGNFQFILYIEALNATNIDRPAAFFKANNQGLVSSAKITDTTNLHHVGIVYDGTNMKIVQDGVEVASGGNSAWDNLYDATFMIGAENYSSPKSFFGGLIDEVRISNIARYSGNYTVPTGPFTSDANTKELWHLDVTS